MHTKVFFLFSFFLFLVLSCSNPFANQQLAMTTDPGVTEAWLSLHVDGVKSGADYILQRDGKTIFSGKLQTPDTVVYDSLLQPATTYTYRFYARENGENSPALQSTLTTLDTTSHNFSWQSYEFGDGASSSFYDVAIIDENDIWAVGEIYMEDTYTRDSLGNIIQPYNAAHWDGQKWELKRVKTAACGGVVYPPLETVFVFSKDDIVFSDGAMLIHFDGNSFDSDCSLIPKLTGGIRKIWGTSFNDFYVVGTSGFIAHYNGTSWTKIESGTDLPIRDIWGVKEPGKNKYKVLAIASRRLTADESIVLQISDNEANIISSQGLPHTISSIWSAKGRQWYICGDGFYQNNLKNKTWLPIQSIPSIFQESIRGENLNNIFIGGVLGLLMHWNGRSWHQIGPDQNTILALSSKRKVFIGAGYVYTDLIVGAASILMGYQN